ncbi:MAG: A24 family peptidase [bacterium]
MEFQPYGLARLLFMLFFASILILVIASDAKYNLIYDIVVLPSVIVAFIWHFAIGGKILDMILGAMVGAIFFGLQYLLSNGRWIGYGDVKLSILIGVLFGWLGTLFVIGIAYILGTAASLIWLLKREKTMKSTLPLGVFLGIAGLYILIYGTRPLERLMHL